MRGIGSAHPLLLSPLWYIRVAKTVFVWFIETDSDQAKRVNVLPHLSCSLPASLRRGAGSLGDAPGSGPGGEGADLSQCYCFAVLMRVLSCKNPVDARLE